MICSKLEYVSSMRKCPFMPIKLHFNESDILQQQFSTRFKGYDPKQVNSFLDLVMVDYRTLKQGITELQQRNDYLHYHLTPLKHQVNTLKTRAIKNQTDAKLELHANDIKMTKMQEKLSLKQQELTSARKKNMQWQNSFNKKVTNLKSNKHMSSLAKKLMSQHLDYQEHPWKDPKNILSILQRLENLESIIL